MKNNALQKVTPEIHLFKDDNDFMPVMEIIVTDLDNHVTEECIDPMVSVWSVKILELASRSIKESRKIDFLLEVS